jgi:hypothetical protein
MDAIVLEQQRKNPCAAQFAGPRLYGERLQFGHDEPPKSADRVDAVFEEQVVCRTAWLQFFSKRDRSKQSALAICIARCE